jgi:hypothetical protein
MVAALTFLVAGPTVTCAEKDPGLRQQELRTRLSELTAEGAFDEIEELNAQLSDLPVVSPSVFWEEIEACGFYPQESRLECVIKIKQATGYGGPVGAFGSFEYVQFCVDWNGNGIFDTFAPRGSTEAVGHGNVHMHDQPTGPAGPTPPWDYAVYRDIDLPGGPRTSLGGATTTTMTSAPSMKARAILSWLYQPTDCDYVPIWGSIRDFQIRLDPIR